MSGITALFATPFYTGSVTATAGNVPWDLEVAIGGHAYKINVGEYQRQTLPYLRQPQDNEAEAGEQSLATEGWWKRTITDWSLGAGQLWGDDPRIESSNRRFYASLGVDPWTRGELRLAADVESIGEGPYSRLIWANGYLYAFNATTNHVEWADADEVRDVALATDPSLATAPTWSNSALYSTGAGYTLGNLLCVGDAVYAALGTGGVRKTTIGTTTAAAWCSHHADVVGYANGFMLIGDGTDIHSVSASGSASASLFTHWASDFKWKTFLDTPTGVVAIGGTQPATGEGTSEFYFIGLDDATGALKTPVAAGRLPDGETVLGAHYYQGVIVLGTTAGLRLAELANNGVMYGPVFATGYANNQYGANTGNFASQGRFVYFQWDLFPDWYGIGQTPAGARSMTGMGRIDLSSFTSTLIPAYATDVMVEDALATGGDGGIVVFDADIPIRVFAADGGIYVSTAYRSVSSGWVLSSRYRFGTQETKLLSSVDLRHNTLEIDQSVEVAISMDDEGHYATPESIGLSQTVGTARPASPLSAHAEPNELISLLVRINDDSPLRSTATDIGRLYRWTARAAVTPYRQDEILVPIILFDVVDTNDEYGHDTYYNTRAEYDFLKALESSRQVVTYQEGSENLQVVVDRVIVKPYSWNMDKTFFNGTVYVRLLTVEV